MPDLALSLACVVPGASTGVAVLAMARRPLVLAPLIDSVEDRLIAPRRITLRRRLAIEIQRAGWADSPERVMVLTLCLAAGLAALGLAAALVAWPAAAAALALGAACGGVGGVGFALRNAVR